MRSRAARATASDGLATVAKNSREAGIHRWEAIDVTAEGDSAACRVRLYMVGASSGVEDTEGVQRACHDPRWAHHEARVVLRPGRSAHAARRRWPMTLMREADGYRIESDRGDPATASSCGGRRWQAADVLPKGSRVRSRGAHTNCHDDLPAEQTQRGSSGRGFAGSGGLSSNAVLLHCTCSGRSERRSHKWRLLPVRGDRDPHVADRCRSRGARPRAVAEADVSAPVPDRAGSRS